MRKSLALCWQNFNSERLSSAYVCLFHHEYLRRRLVECKRGKCLCFCGCCCTYLPVWSMRYCLTIIIKIMLINYCLIYISFKLSVKAVVTVLRKILESMQLLRLSWWISSILLGGVSSRSLRAHVLHIWTHSYMRLGRILKIVTVLNIIIFVDSDHIFVEYVSVITDRFHSSRDHLGRSKMFACQKKGMQIIRFC